MLQVGRGAGQTHRPLLLEWGSVTVRKLWVWWVSGHEIAQGPGWDCTFQRIRAQAARSTLCTLAYILHPRGHWVERDASRDTATRSPAATRSLQSLVKACICLSNLAVPLAHRAKGPLAHACVHACMRYITWNSAVVVCVEATLLLHRARMTRFSSSGTSSEWKLAHVSFAPAGSPFLVRPISSSCPPACAVCTHPQSIDKRPVMPHSKRPHSLIMARHACSTVFRSVRMIPCAWKRPASDGHLQHPRGCSDAIHTRERKTKRCVHL